MKLAADRRLAQKGPGKPRIPRYRAIAAELTRRMSEGILQPGETLPSEDALAEEFEVTRMTVRHALAGLAAQNLIEKRHGSRNLVAARTVFHRNPQRPTSLTDEMTARGLRPGSHILELSEVRPDPVVRESLRLGSRARVTRIYRLRLGDGIILAIQETFITSRAVPGLIGRNLNGESVSRILREDYGLTLTSAEVTIQAVEATDEQATLLGLAAGSALLKVSRTTYLSDGRPIERTTGWFPGSRFDYQLWQGPAAGSFSHDSSAVSIGETKRESAPKPSADESAT